MRLLHAFLFALAAGWLASGGVVARTNVESTPRRSGEDRPGPTLSPWSDDADSETEWTSGPNEGPVPVSCERHPAECGERPVWRITPRRNWSETRADRRFSTLVGTVVLVI